MNVHISIEIENIDESINERAQRIADRITAEESERVRNRLQNYLAEEFGVKFVGQALLKGASDGECSMGVGCREAGVCFAAAAGEPDRCDARGGIFRKKNNNDE